MRNISSIFNFNPFRYTLVWVLIFTMVFEVSISWLCRDIFYHEVDKLIYSINNTEYDSKYVLLGDSIAHQLADIYEMKTTEFANLTSNQAIETTGQYFVLKRYLEKNKKPMAVILISLNPLEGDLNQGGTENFIQRVFLRFDEIIELYKYKGLKFSFVMLFYKFFSSYRYRLHIQEQLLGISNSNPYNGILFPYNGLSYPGINGKKTFISSVDATKISYKVNDFPISTVFLCEIIDLLKQNSINFYYIEPPVKKSLYDDIYFQARYNRKKEIFQMLQFKNSNFHFFMDLDLFPDEYYTKDGIHFTDEGKKIAQEKLDTYIKEIQKMNGI